MSHNLKRLFIAIPLDQEVQNNLAKISERRSHPAFTYTPSLPRSDEGFSFVADRLTLFESKLGGEYSEYKEIHSVKLNSLRRIRQTSFP